jgi:hypothetical protein
MLGGADVPAWLQAFAAVVALGISVWATLKPGIDEKRKERLRGRSIAVAIFPELLKLEPIIAGAERSLEYLKSNDRVLINSVTNNLLSAQIQVPPMLERNIDNFYLLGEPAGAACIQLVSLVDQFDSLVEAIAARIMVMTVEQWHEAMDHLQAYLTLLRSVIEKAKEEVQPLHDQIKD